MSVFDSFPEAYGYRVIAFPSTERRSMVYAIPGHDVPRRSLAALVSLIRRRMGYLVLIEDLTLDTLVKQGYLKYSERTSEDGEDYLELEIFDDPQDDAERVTYAEF